MSRLPNTLYGDFASGGVMITQSDTVDVPYGPVALLVTASSGAVKILTKDGNALTINVPAAGWICPFMVTRVYDTGTSVADADLIGIRL